MDALAGWMNNAAPAPITPENKKKFDFLVNAETLIVVVMIVFSGICMNPNIPMPPYAFGGVILGLGLIKTVIEYHQFKIINGSKVAKVLCAIFVITLFLNSITSFTNPAGFRSAAQSLLIGNVIYIILNLAIKKALVGGCSMPRQLPFGMGA